MEAMHCLRMPHGPAGGPDRPQYSSSSRRNPLLRRHLAFPKGGARVAAAPQWTVRAQAPAPPSQPEEEGANSKGRLGGWHRTRGAAVGAAVVLACALGAACLNRRGGAYCCPQGPITAGQAPQPAPAGGYASLTVAERPRCVLSGMFKPRAAAPREPSMLLQHVIEEIKDEVCFLGLQPERVRFLRSLVEHLHDELVEDYCCLEASRREYATMNSLYEEWSRLQDKHRKYELGLLLMEILISKRDYHKALTICEDLLRLGPSKDGGSPSDGRPHLYLAIIKMMLAVERILESKTTDHLDETIKKVKGEWTQWKEWEDFQAQAINTTN